MFLEAAKMIANEAGTYPEAGKILSGNHKISIMEESEEG